MDISADGRKFIVKLYLTVFTDANIFDAVIFNYVNTVKINIAI